ncbi:MAG TPA: Arm DNA-binding domain-containing protein, partial [Xanthobacteraceae bacterium]|nr:Arm DNA-binding domain-containing protein [Xanthobacteraceae bacterium]
MPLTDATVRGAKAGAKPRKISDGGGLFLLIQPGGGKLWRLAYRFDGKQRTQALGVYPEVSLGQARGGRDQTKKLLAQGIDPSVQRKREKQRAATSAANTFQVVANELMAKHEREGRAERTLEK